MNDQQPRDSHGRFGAKPQAESEVSLDAPALVPVRDHGGDPVYLDPGVRNDEARYAYSQGQGLALAVAIARRNDWDLVVEWQRSTGDDVYLRHAYALSDDNRIIDIGGAQPYDSEAQPDPDLLDEDGFDVEYETKFEKVPADRREDRLPDLLAACLSEQDLATAETFVDPVLGDLS